MYNKVIICKTSTYMTIFLQNKKIKKHYKNKYPKLYIVEQLLYFFT